ncbi:hypothetical protein [Modicisalibacter coralii]|uniref:hypothetical protein n=1 Tax=Modicisalibacter coralii TaxID=2304602 RepID=UPI00100AF348|nr:hypothetical protein [Halomonas coralii]
MHGRRETRIAGLLAGVVMAWMGAGPLAAQAGEGGAYLLGDGQGGWTVQPLDADGLAPPRALRHDEYWRGVPRNDARWWRHDDRWRDGGYRHWRGERHPPWPPRHDHWPGGDRWGGHWPHGPYPRWPAPEIEVHVDGLSGGVNPPRAEDTGPDQCHQSRRDTWSTDALDCPQPDPSERGQSWSTSP